MRKVTQPLARVRMESKKTLRKSFSEKSKEILKIIWLRALMRKDWEERSPRIIFQRDARDRIKKEGGKGRSTNPDKKKCRHPITYGSR